MFGFPMIKEMNSTNTKVLFDAIKIVKMSLVHSCVVSGGDSDGKHFGIMFQAPKEAFTALASVAQLG